MSDTVIKLIPPLSLIYKDNLLEMVSIDGERYRRETPLSAENAVLRAENAKLRVLCRDMMLVVECCDLDNMRLQAHGKDADWRELRERFDELLGVEVDE